MFRFAGVADGCYFITGHSEGLEGLSEPFCLPGLDGAVVVPMRVQEVVETVVVQASAIGINPVETSSQGEVGQATLDNAPKANRSFDDVLPLIPGVVRGPSGEINLNGARNTQSGARVNGADVTDPVTRQSEVNMPANVVNRIEVLSSPYDAQYGGFTGALSRIQTKSGNMTKFNISLQNFNPRMRKRDGTIMGIESATPRLTLTGPIKKGRIAFLQAIEYQFVRTQQEDAKLPQLARDTEREALSVFNQVDIQASDKNTATLNVLFFPEKLNFFGLDAFHPQPTTPDLRRRGMLSTLRDAHQFASGATLLSQFDVQDLDADVKPLGYDDYRLGLEEASGSYFHRESRHSLRRQWSERYHFAPFQAAGGHQIKVGGSIGQERYNGLQTYNPVTWLGVDDQVVRRMTFGPPASVEARKRDYAAYIQDKWQPFVGLTLDIGARVERDSLGRKTNPSYRSGFAYTIGKGGRTVLRGGSGLFYDRISLAVPTFLDLPARTQTLYGPGDPLGVSQLFEQRFDGRLRNPRTLSWSLQLEREVIQNLFLRAGYQQRRTTHNFLIERRDGLDGVGTLALTNKGRDSYREWQLTSRYRIRSDNHITASYIRSSSVGDLNDLASILGETPAALIQPNQRAPLAFDAPNRFLFWADIGLPWELRAAPVLELRQGFPYSLQNEFREIVGARNRGGRFPTYKTLDLQVTKRFSLNIAGKERNFRLGVRTFNVLNQFNPRDVQSNIDSPFYGVFYRGMKRRLRGVLEIGN
ncbi:MAG: TonB-dependent receptor plug domain-containing protein [Bryobacterales bacterium]